TTTDDTDCLELPKHASDFFTPKMESVEASESGDYLSFYTHPSSSMKIPTFNLFDTMAAAGIYDSTISSSSNGNNKTNLHYTGQHIYSTNNNDYTSPISPSNEYWSYSTQSYFPGTHKTIYDQSSIFNVNV
ncbi:unnamed protein product, partial [Rotaria sp. Silwood2]